jgi:hypothetical protein
MNALGAVLANKSAADRNFSDFYPTPEEVTRALMAHLQLPAGTAIWEPAAGEGHMERALKTLGYSVDCSDLNTYDGVDFLTTETTRAPWIITNPPFSLSEEFIRHSHDLLKGVEGSGFAMLLKSQYWHAAKRTDLFSVIQPTYILPLTWRPDFLFGKKSGSPTMDVQWSVWEYPYTNQTTVYCPLKKLARQQ